MDTTSSCTSLREAEWRRLEFGLRGRAEADFGLGCAEWLESESGLEAELGLGWVDAELGLGRLETELRRGKVANLETEAELGLWLCSLVVGMLEVDWLLRCLPISFQFYIATQIYATQ